MKETLQSAKLRRCLVANPCYKNNYGTRYDYCHDFLLFKYMLQLRHKRVVFSLYRVSSMGHSSSLGGFSVVFVEAGRKERSKSRLNLLRNRVIPPPNKKL